MSFPQQDELLALLESLCEATITPQQQTQLQALLRENTRAQRLYVEYMMFAADLRKTLSVCSEPMVWPSDGADLLSRNGPVSTSRPEGAAEPGFAWAATGQVDQTSWEISARKEAIRAHAEQMFERFKADEARRLEELAYRQYLARRRRLLVGAGSLAALLIVFLMAWLFGSRPELSKPVAAPSEPARPPVIARIVRSLNARWLQQELSTEPGTSLRPSSVYLTQGLVELAFDGGAEAIVQAPADLRLEGMDQVFLQAGVISARIAGGSSGFIVRTPTGTVVDYGTEFGVIVNKDGETEALVYEGRVGLRSGSDPVRSVASRILREGQAGAVDASGQVVDREFRPRQVIREMPETAGFGIPGKRLSLADVIGGGNGYGSGKLGCGIDPGTGGFCTSFSYNNKRQGNPAYVGVPSLPFVDGVFVPDGENGSPQVSSMGHRFTSCPDTTNIYYYCVANGGKLLNWGHDTFAPMVLNGQVYGDLAHPAIVMHPNLGVTFDLDAIRDTLPGSRIVRFVSTCGISSTAPPSGNGASFWVLIDGKIGSEWRSVYKENGAVPIMVELQDEDRFLTLITTDAGDLADDYCLFAEPALELEPCSGASRAHIDVSAWRTHGE